MNWEIEDDTQNAIDGYCCFMFKLCPTILQLHGIQPARLLCPWDFPEKNTGVGCHFLLQYTIDVHTMYKTHN